MVKKIANSKFGIPILFVILIAINWIAATLHNRIDLTNEKRFTLGTPTKTILKSIDEPITIIVFLKGNFPSGFRQLAQATNNVLVECKEIAGAKLKFNFINPDEAIPNTNITYADSISAMGMYPINLTSQIKDGQQQQFVYPHAWVHYKDKLEVIELYKGKSPQISFAEISSAEALLEYKIISSIANIMQQTKPTVAYAVGNGEPTDYTTYDLSENVLNKNYRYAPFNLNAPIFLPKQIDVLMIVKPTIPFTDFQKFKIDQYVMNGGKLLIFADRLNAEMDSLQSKKGEVTAFDRNLKINDLIFNYGARINADLIMDLQCDVLPMDINGNGQYDFLPWNYFPVLESNGSHPINKGLGFVVAQFANSIDTVDADGISKTVLLQTSANARTISAPAIISAAENVNAPINQKFNKANVAAAVLLEGKFTSVFNNRLTTNFKDSLAKTNATFVSKNIQPNKIIIVSDGDIVLNSTIKGSPIPMGKNKFTIDTQREFPFANIDFVSNCLSYLINDNGLNQIKGKEFTTRLLDAKKVQQQKTFWQIINIALPIGIILLIALIYNYLRKKKYAI